MQTAMLDWLFERQMWAPYLSLLHEHLAEHLAEAFGFESVLGGHDVLGREVHLWCDQLLGAVKTYQDIAKGKADPGKIRAPGLRGTRSDDAELLEKFDRYQRFEMMTLLGSFVDVPANQDVLKLSEQIRSTRNSLMHGGLGLDPGAVTANKLRHKIEGYHTAYKALARPLFHVDLARLEGLGVPD